MAKISGGLEHATRLRKGLVEGTKLVNQALFVAAQRVQVDAQISITEGAVSGAGHVAAPAGSAPNNDTAVLANNIEAVQGRNLAVGSVNAQGGIDQAEASSLNPTEDLVSQVSSNAPYAAAMEFGFHDKNGKFHGPWPYMAPALQKNKARITQDIARAINIANRRGK